MHVKFDDLWQLCRDHPDIQVMLDEAVKGKHGERTDLKSNFFYNVQEVQPPTGNTRASFIRKLSRQEKGFGLYRCCNRANLSKHFSKKF
ncbi:MAG TPA: hypothetical protein V6D09_23120 [Leptolyngbyaceae cyanobacterium]